MDQNAPEQVTAGSGHGLLLDLGSHVVDQLSWLLGPVRAVTAHLDWVELPEGRTDGGFAIDLVHASGASSFAESSKLGYISARELRAYGSLGSYSAASTDVQADAVAAGQRPAADPEHWGYEAPERWGILATAAGQTAVQSAQGRWHDLYSQFAAAIRGYGQQPVPAAEAIHTLEVLDAARRVRCAESPSSCERGHSRGWRAGAAGRRRGRTSRAPVRVSPRPPGYIAERAR